MSVCLLPVMVMESNQWEHRLFWAWHPGPAYWGYWVCVAGACIQVYWECPELAKEVKTDSPSSFWISENNNKILFIFSMSSEIFW